MNPNTLLGKRKGGIKKRKKNNSIFFMCGIIGGTNISKINPREGLKKILHRGKDNTGIFNDLYPKKWTRKCLFFVFKKQTG